MLRFHRRLLPADAPAYRDHLLRLLPDDRRWRFGGAVGDAWISDHAARLDYSRAILIGGFAGGLLVGSALVIGGEMAVTTEAGHRRQGLGSALVQAALTQARNRGLAEVAIFYDPDNQAMARLAARFARQRRLDQGMVEARVPLDYPSPWSLAAEAVDEAIGGIAARLAAA